MNWKDVVKELDHPEFMVRDRQAFVLLVTALRRALPTEQYIDLLYGRWTNVEGQVRESLPIEFSESRTRPSGLLVIMAGTGHSSSRRLLSWRSCDTFRVCRLLETSAGRRQGNVDMVGEKLHYL